MSTQPRPEPGEPVRPLGESLALGEREGIHGQWGAIVAGAFAGFAAFILLAVLGIAIGVTAGQPMSGEAAGIAAGIWWILTLLAASIFGGWVLGRTARRMGQFMPFVYGTVTWVLGTVIMLFLLTMGVGNIIGGVGGAVGQAMAGQPLPSTEQIDVAGIATSTAWVLFASMVIGLVGTIIGARIGSPERRREKEYRREHPRLAA